MLSILNNVTLLRQVALEIGADNEPLRHTGEASHLFKLRLPMTKDTAELLFAAISVDTTLPKKKKVGAVANAEVVTNAPVTNIELTRNAENSSTVFDMINIQAP
jgi:hypothetical protein